MAYKFGQFVWCELVTNNVDDGRAFWTASAGFGTTEMDMGGQPYLMLTGPKGTVGGVVKPQMEGVPPHFTAYLSVEDVDAACAKVQALGGRILVPPMDIPVGRFAVIADPQGATLQVFKGADGDDNGSSGVGWFELWSRDAAAVAPFYEQAFGLTCEVTSMPMGPYHILKRGDTSVAGILTSPDPKVPPMWLPYLEVDDVDQVVAAARQHGGAVIAEAMSVDGVGRFAIVADRQGAVGGVLRSVSR